MNRITRALRAGWLVMAVAVTACSPVGWGGGTPPAAGTESVELPDPGSEGFRRLYGGSVTFDGNRISLTLELVEVSGEVSARLSIPSLDLDAGGAGEIVDGQLTLDLAYGGDCPGRLEFSGTFREVRRRVEGRLTASDCTGEETGAVVLLVRPGGA